MSVSTQAHSARAGWAIEDLQIFDRSLRRARAEMRDSIRFLNASAGIWTTKDAAAFDRIDDLLVDVYANAREQLLRTIDEHGGAAMRLRHEGWPLDQKDAAA